MTNLRCETCPLWTPTFRAGTGDCHLRHNPERLPVAASWWCDAHPDFEWPARAVKPGPEPAWEEDVRLPKGFKVIQSVVDKDTWLIVTPNGQWPAPLYSTKAAAIAAAREHAAQSTTAGADDVPSVDAIPVAEPAQPTPSDALVERVAKAISPKFWKYPPTQASARAAIAEVLASLPDEEELIQMIDGPGSYSVIARAILARIKGDDQ